MANKETREQMEFALSIAESSLISAQAISDIEYLPPVTGGSLCGCRANPHFKQHIFVPRSKPTLDFWPRLWRNWQQSGYSFAEQNTHVEANSSAIARSKSFSWSSSVTIQSGVSFGLVATVDKSLGSSESEGEELTFGRETQEWVAITTTTTFECPQGNYCALFLVDFDVTYQGEAASIPGIDFAGCHNVENIPWQFGNQRVNYDLSMTSKLTVASLNGLSPKWDSAGQQHYSLNNGNMTESSSRGKRWLDIWWPPSNIDVKLKNWEPKAHTIPAKRYAEKSGKAETLASFIWVTRSNSLRRPTRNSEDHSADEGLEADGGAKIYIAGSNIPGLSPGLSLERKR